MAATYLPDGRSAPVPFPSIDALALHLLRQRPGRKLELLAQTCTRDGGPDFAVVAVFALRPATRKMRDGWISHVGADEWLGWTTGGLAADPDALQAAIDRMSSAQGLAA